MVAFGLPRTQVGTRFFSFPLAIVPLLAATGLLVGQTGDGRRETMLVLLAEPLLWVGAVWAAYDAWSRKERALVFAILAGGLAASLTVRLPHPSETTVVARPPVSDRLRACARGLPLPADSVRVATWHLDPRADPSVAQVILGASPDVVVLGGADEGIIDAVASGLGGESRRVATPEGAVTVLTRGVFHACGDDDGWSDAPVSGAASVFLFAAPADGTTLPLLVARLPDPLREPDWDRRAAEGRARLAAFVDGLGSSLLLAVVDAVQPGVTRRLEHVLGRTLLVPTARPATWPARVGPLPWPFPVHPFDSLWVGGAWRVGAIDTLRARGAERLGLYVRLDPRVGVRLVPP